jgi:uncharacterized protein
MTQTARDALRAQQVLVESLRDPAHYPHTTARIEVLETHISYVLLTGPYAYKIKKPLDLGFLDFSTLEKRRLACEDELRLNRRLAPQLYVGVVPVGGSPEAPALGGGGEPIEYAVKMVQFPQEALLDRALTRGAVRAEQVIALARQVAAFHARLPVADDTTPFGTPEALHRPAEDNFRQIRRELPEGAAGAQLGRLEEWTRDEYERLQPHLLARKREGCIRECHGDMHSGNMVLLEGQVVVFDCLEFNEALRWIDVMSEVAFVVMDFEDRGHAGLARLFLNAYLEAAGDYSGLRVLRYYLVYRALVRAKVTAIRMGQRGAPAGLHARFRAYLHLAEQFTRPIRPVLILTCGPSGAGKSHHSQALIEALGAVRIRSDVVRKALFGLGSDARSGSELGTGLYGPQAGERTYERLGELVGRVLRAGYPAIADATFLRRAQRERMRGVAARLGMPCITLVFEAAPAVLRERVTRRLREAADASEATLEVLEHQLRSAEPLSDEERPRSIIIETDKAVDMAAVVRRVAALSGSRHA